MSSFRDPWKGGPPLCKLLENSCDSAPTPPPLLTHRPGRGGQAAPVPGPSPWPGTKGTTLVSGEPAENLVWVDVLRSPTTLSREQFTMSPDSHCEVRGKENSHLPSSLHQDQAREGGQRYHFSREFRASENSPRREKIWEKVIGPPLPQSQAGSPGPLSPRLHIPAALAEGQAPPHFPFLPTLFHFLPSDPPQKLPLNPQGLSIPPPG